MDVQDDRVVDCNTKNLRAREGNTRESESERCARGQGFPPVLMGVESSFVVVVLFKCVLSRLC